MKTAPITPARIAFDATDDEAHAVRDALAQARDVFLGGNGLPGRWAGRERFVICETGFGMGHNFLATWAAWRADPARCERLVFISVELHPPTPWDLERAHAVSLTDAVDAVDAALPPLAELLRAAWPPATPTLHPIDFEQGRVRLLLALGDVRQLLPQLMAQVDAFFLDGVAPRFDPTEWRADVLKQLGRLAGPGATVASWSTAASVQAGLLTAGFEVETVQRPSLQREMTLARHAPRHRPAPLAGGLQATASTGAARAALVVGAGLAGCAAAWALAREGWHVTVLDREATPAQATSGNAVGLFHGAVHAGDGPHARLHRAAALRAARVLRPWMASGRVRGQIDGLMRLDPGPFDAATGAYASGHARFIGQHEARTLTGVSVEGGGWWFCEGGWVVPGDFCRALLEDSGAHFIGQADVEQIEHRDGRWHALDARGATLGVAPVMVLANALQIPRLLGGDMAEALGGLTAARGQVTGIPVHAWPHGAAVPRVPISGAGYVVAAKGAPLWCGATTQAGDADSAVRDTDHRHNLAQLAALLGDRRIAEMPIEGLTGRVGWRAVTPDRLPWVGAVPDLAACATASRVDRVRDVPRLRDAAGGLHVLGALGSRGITWAVLCGELLASWATGSPCPVEADLRDALDPARRLVAQRRGHAAAAAQHRDRIDS